MKFRIDTKKRLDTKFRVETKFQAGANVDLTLNGESTQKKSLLTFLTINCTKSHKKFKDNNNMVQGLFATPMIFENDEIILSGFLET